VFGSLFGKKNNALPEPGPEVSCPEVSSLENFSPENHASESSVPESSVSPNSLMDGLTIEEYARRQYLSQDEVWNLLRRGQLVGRTSRGKVLVYESIGAAAIANPAPTTVRQPSEGDLPPLEFGATTTPSEALQGATSAGFPGTPNAIVSLENSGLPQSTELALLLDHLSLAKEENREILRLTQDTLTKLSAMTDAVVQMKDEVIKSKDVQLAALREALEHKDRTMAQLLQEKEDLEILNRTLGTALGNAAGPGQE